MKRVLYGLALAFAVSAFAQQQPPTNSPPYTTPPTFPEDQAPRQQMPPDTKAPPPRAAFSTAQIGQQIQEMLDNEPALADTNLAVKANDLSVTLTGTVATEGQHDLALRIAQSYAGERKVVDKIKVRGQA